MSSEEIPVYNFSIVDNEYTDKMKKNLVNFPKIENVQSMKNSQKVDSKVDLVNSEWITVERKGRHRQKQICSKIFKVEIGNESLDEDEEPLPRQLTGMSRKKSR